MTIRFAAATRGHGSVVARMVRVSYPLGAANDNVWPFRIDATVATTLRHFARHGLGAARQARENARSALASGDRQAFEQWLEVCRMLDRRIGEATGAERATGD